MDSEITSLFPSPRAVPPVSVYTFSVALELSWIVNWVALYVDANTISVKVMMT